MTGKRKMISMIPYPSDSEIEINFLSEADPTLETMVEIKADLDKAESSFYEQIPYHETNVPIGEMMQRYVLDVTEADLKSMSEENAIAVRANKQYILQIEKDTESKLLTKVHGVSDRVSWDEPASRYVRLLTIETYGTTGGKDTPVMTAEGGIDAIASGWTLKNVSRINFLGYILGKDNTGGA